MLSPDQLQDAGDAVAAIYSDMEARMLDHLVDAMLNGAPLTQRTVTELNLLAQSQTSALAKIIRDNREAISDAVYETAERLLTASDKDDARRLEASDITFPAQLAATVAGMQLVLDRDNLDMVEGAKRAFLTCSLEAVTKANSGLFTADQALHSAVRKLERDGISVISYRNAETGVQTVQNKVDVAVRRHVRTQIAQDGARMTLGRMEGLGVALVEVSSHEGSRPSHAEWQGRVYSLRGDVTVDGTRYPDFYSATGYGSVDGLMGANCRHSFGPYLHGSPRAYKPDPEHPSGLPNDEIYELTQKQRYMECQVRAAKRELRGAQQLYERDQGLPSKTALLKAQERLRSRQEGLRDLIREANAKCKPGTTVLHRNRSREWAGDMPASAKVNASHRKLDAFLDSKAKQLKAAGVSKARMRAAISGEMARRGGTAKDFASLAASEQQGTFHSLFGRMTGEAKSTRKANAGKHVAKKQYVPCATKKEALAFAKDTLGFEKISSALTVAELNKLNAAFYSQMQDFPFMKGYVKTIQTGKMSACACFKIERETVGAGRYVHKPIFKFDRTSLKNAERDSKLMCQPLEQYDGASWWTKKEGADGLVAHEFAHAVEYKVTMKRLGFDAEDAVGISEVAALNKARGSVSSEIVKEAFERVGIKCTQDNVMKHVSAYGKENTLETLAEALSCEDSGNAVCNAIKEVTRELLKKEGLL